MLNMIKYTTILIAIAIFLNCCKKETPPTIDNVPPLISLALSSEDTMRTLFFSSDNMVLGKVNMKPNTKYNYIIAVFDTSGLKNTLFRLTKIENITYEFSSTPNPYYFNHPTDHFYNFNDSLLGTNYTRYFISGSFTTPPVNSPMPFNFNVQSRDYKPSTSTININFEIDNNPDEDRWGWINL